MASSATTAIGGLIEKEFRGFALADARAPLVFINGADAKAAQMFTLAHALAHIWLGQSALSDVTPIAAPEHEVERWCSAVAAEVLVPLGAVRAEYRRGEELRHQSQDRAGARSGDACYAARARRRGDRVREFCCTCSQPLVARSVGAAMSAITPLLVDKQKSPDATDRSF
jgi:hypothetical protein